MKGSLGKKGGVSGIAKIIRDQLKSEDEFNLLKVLRTENKELTEIESIDNPRLLSPDIRLKFILYRYHLNKEENFDEMFDELRMILFEPFRKKELIVEKAFQVNYDLLHTPLDDIDCSSIDLTDPIDRKLSLAEEFFDRYHICEKYKKYLFYYSLFSLSLPISLFFCLFFFFSLFLSLFYYFIIYF